MALRAGYYGIKRRLKTKLAEIAGVWDDTVSSIFPRSEQAVLGAKNLLPIRLTDIKTLNTGGTWNDNIYTQNGITYTFEVENDYVKSISTTGTASGTSSLYLNTNFLFNQDAKYIMNGCPDANNNQVWLGVYRTTPTTGYEYYSINGNDSNVIGYSEDTVRAIRIRISDGANANGLTFYPMIRLATDTDPTYVPYAMTNRKLTASTADQKTAINAIITAATSAADFAAFKTAMGAITPVTRSLSREASPEDVPEEVIEEEKPVTKKTTKKTVKEGE